MQITVMELQMQWFYIMGMKRFTNQSFTRIYPKNIQNSRYLVGIVWWIYLLGVAGKPTIQQKVLRYGSSISKLFTQHNRTISLNFPYSYLLDQNSCYDSVLSCLDGVLTIYNESSNCEGDHLEQYSQLTDAKYVELISSVNWLYCSRWSPSQFDDSL